MSTRIFVVDDNEMNLKLTAGVLKADGFEVAAAVNGEEALAAIGPAQPSLAILDVMMPDMDGYELCRRLRQRPDTANIPIIILTGLTELDERLKAFEAGADDFIAKPFQPKELLARVKVLLRRAAPSETAAAETRGEMLAVFSLRGGIGVSTLAANLSIGFAQVWSYPIALVDLALVNGQSALMLDLPLRNSWGDLAPIRAGEIDAEVVHRVLLRHESGVQVLAAPPRPEEAEALKGEQVQGVLEILHRQFEYILLDLPHDFNATTLAALDSADRILLVTAPELAAVRCASAALDVFERLEYPKEKIDLVLNWTFKGKGLSRTEIEKVLKREIRIVIPHAADTLVTALTFGRSSVFTEPDGPVGALFEDLSYYWSKENHKQTPPDHPKEGYVRVLERSRKRQEKS
jgi:pilus assembly protein CpaE